MLRNKGGGLHNLHRSEPDCCETRGGGLHRNPTDETSEVLVGQDFPPQRSMQAFIVFHQGDFSPSNGGFLNEYAKLILPYSLGNIFAYAKKSLF